MEQRKFINILESVHFRIFGHSISEQMMVFLKNLSWSLFGGIVASFLMLAVNIGVGRYFGPEEYGKYNLILSVSQILLVFIYLGTDVSSVRYISREEGLQRKRSFLSSSFYFVVGTILFSWVVYYLMHQLIESSFHVDGQYILFPLIFGTFLALKGMLDGYLRAFSLFRFQAYLRVVEACVVVVFLILTLVVIGVREYQYYIYAIVSGAAIFSIVTLYRLRWSLRPFDAKSLQLMLSYGHIVLLGTVLSVVFNSLDKLIIAKYLGVAQLGIYSAYFMTSTNLIAQMTQVFNNVFFPAISQVSDTAYVEKMNILVRRLFIPGGIILSGLLYGILLVFGRAYEPNIFLSISFGFLAILQIILTINASIITALSRALLKKYYFWLYVVSFCHIIFYGVLIYYGLISILALIFLFFANFLSVIFIQKWLIRRFIGSSGALFPA